jgi:hypothetical protein
MAEIRSQIIGESTRDSDAPQSAGQRSSRRRPQLIDGTLDPPIGTGGGATRLVARATCRICVVPLNDLAFSCIV